MTSLVRSIIRAEIQHLIHQTESIDPVALRHPLRTFTEGKAFTLLSSPTYGYKLNRTEGFGINGPVTSEDLLAIEKVWESSELQPEIHLCEYAHASAHDLLSGYVKTGELCSFHLALEALETDPSSPIPDGITVSLMTDVEDFIPASVRGFRSNGRSEELLYLLAQSAAGRTETDLFAASINGDLVGTAGMAILEVDGEKFANLYIDSTQPGFRARGVHRALLLARVAAAKACGCQHVIAAARADSGSARNIEKAGLRLAFTTGVYQKVSPS